MHREPRLDHGASWEAIHEAGHAVERCVIHGTTGAIKRNPFEGKAAGAETEPLPPELLKPGTQTLRDTPPPFSLEEIRRLEDEIKVTLAGSAAEALCRGKEPLDVLDEHEQSSDHAYAYSLAKRLWDYDKIDGEMSRLAGEVESEIDGAWEAVVAVAEAFEETEGGLSAEAVREIVSSAP